MSVSTQSCVNWILEQNTILKSLPKSKNVVSMGHSVIFSNFNDSFFEESSQNVYLKKETQIRKAKNIF